MIISLVGFMGTGKSSIGRLLAAKLNYKFLDTDELIEDRTALTIPQIFAGCGEEYFRELEEEVLAEIMKSEKNMVIATGGGIVLSARNRMKLKEYTCPVLLQASPAEIIRRVSIENRPLLANSDNPRKVIHDLLKKRKNFYNEFKVNIKTDKKTKKQIVEEIIKLTGAERDDEKDQC